MIFQSKHCYAPERTRTVHLLSILSKAAGDAEEADRYQEEAVSGYKSIMRERNQAMPPGWLGVEHYNQLVTFWSR